MPLTTQYFDNNNACTYDLEDLETDTKSFCVPWRYVDALWLSLPAFLARLALNALSAGMDISHAASCPYKRPRLLG